MSNFGKRIELCNHVFKFVKALDFKAQTDLSRRLQTHYQCCYNFITLALVKFNTHKSLPIPININLKETNNDTTIYVDQYNEQNLKKIIKNNRYP